jgi:hypothetical protein
VNRVGIAGFWGQLGNVQQGRPGKALSTILRIAWRPVLYADELAYLNMIEQSIRDADLPFRVLSRRPPRPDSVNRAFLVTNLMMPVYARMGGSRDYVKAQLAGNRILLGATAFKSTYGRYPSSLPELRSQLHWATPIDPFSGKEFVYRQKGKGFLLYSFGPNLKDDGGKPRTGRHFYTGDIVWKR